MLLKHYNEDLNTGDANKKDRSKQLAVLCLDGFSTAVNIVTTRYISQIHDFLHAIGRCKYCSMTCCSGVSYTIIYGTIAQKVVLPLSINALNTANMTLPFSTVLFQLYKLAIVSVMICMYK